MIVQWGKLIQGEKIVTRHLHMGSMGFYVNRCNDGPTGKGILINHVGEI
jgi:hypothetical protein